jgi:chromosome segregation protein
MEEAFQGVSLLSDSAKGRANFFVIEYFHAHSQHKPILAPQTVSALTKVNVDAKYNHLINYLLGNVYVLQAADAQQEAQLASEYRKKYPSAVFLSSSGKYIITGQSVGGGSIGLFEGKRLGRKRNLEILTKEMSELEDKIQDFETALQKNNQEINSIKALTKQPQIQEKQQVLQTISAQLQVIQSRQNQHIQFIEKHQNRNDAIQSKMEECERLILQDGPILEQLEKNLGALQTESQSIQEQITLAIETNQALSQEFNQWNTEFLQWQSKFSVLERDHNFNQNQQTVLENRMEKNTLQLDETKKQLSEILQTPELNDVVLVDMYKEKESMDSAVSEADLAVAEAKNKGLEMDQNIRQFRKEKEEIQFVLSELKNSENEILLKKSAVSERLSVEFKIPSEELEALKPTVSIDLFDLKIKVESHKQRLDQFGEINPLALEAYQEISQRFDFISSQKNDLLDSKKILTDTLKEIDKTAKEKFQYAFDLIRSNFQKVFRTLFTEEDTCDLMLLHPDDPLDSPINILARPKGKKPLTINQLSGGEKTLTAIALLFAIYLYKPAPFCIFDEVDAPLDDVNIDKFNRIIREFSAQSQFIIVTHNKRTMETTDVMYGITMVEQGVSRVVPVDLKAVAN